jgi:hypothetical protein
MSPPMVMLGLGLGLVLLPNAATAQSRCLAIKSLNERVNCLEREYVLKNPLSAEADKVLEANQFLCNRGDAASCRYRDKLNAARRRARR